MAGGTYCSAEYLPLTVGTPLIDLNLKWNHVLFAAEAREMD